MNEYYDELSKGYEELYAREQLDKVEFLVPWLENLEGPVLDLGAGTGLLQNFFLPNVSADSSIEMLKKNKNPNRVLCDARFLPFKDDSFNSLISVTMLQDVKEKERILRGIARICKGIIIITILKRNYKKENLDALMSKFFEIVCFDVQEKDYCYYMKRKELKTIKRLRIRF